MRTLTTTSELATFCKQAMTAPYVTIDTEFLRERTYYAQLCLVQIAYPGDGENDAVLVDPLVDGLSLEPLYDLFRDESTVKVFHAARQDLEIFFHDAGVFPTPLFDTQVAAMVCGYGDQVGYETLVRSIAKKPLDKSSRFTDWSRRPLTEAQQTYAIGDVTYLRTIYEHLAKEIATSGRQSWVEEELTILTSKSTYEAHPEEAWKRVKTRNNSGRFMAIVACLAEFRESYAQGRNIPRNRVFKDDAILELASTKPTDMKSLSRSRLLMRDGRKGAIADGILAAVKKGVSMQPEEYPPVPKTKDKIKPNPAIADLLRVLLKAKCEEMDVASKLLASSAELDALATGDKTVPALHGWRYEVFGRDAERLCNGEIALSTKGRRVKVVAL
ncbi:MAG: ribonuclease D [Halocynthiibacter sp.]